MNSRIVDFFTSQLVSLADVLVIFSIIAGLYTFIKWWKREEHFPRINFEINVNVIDEKDGFFILHITSILENKGVVPLKINNFGCEVRGISKDDKLKLGGEEIRNQLNFPHVFARGRFFPKDWDESFVYPSVKATYGFITIIPHDTSYILVKGKFGYPNRAGNHHAEKVVKISNNISPNI